jgi:Transposase DDE domain group 1
MTEDTLLLPCLSPVEGKQVRVAFAGGPQSSDGGVLLLREVDRKVGLADRLAACIPDRRFRMFAIAAVEKGDATLWHQPITMKVKGSVPFS